MEMETFTRFFSWSAFIAILLFIALPMYISRRTVPGNKRRIVILVLGDLSRSPRMLNHAYSAACISSNLIVELIGYAPDQITDLPERIRSSERINITTISTPKKILTHNRVLYLIAALTRVVRQFFAITNILIFMLPNFETLLIQ
ncbi:hypothetical protein HK096_008770, partial [Nowakowskiella sp. JEL0078]